MFLDTIGNFLLIVIGFGFLIFIHELGHFAAAKSVGIKVEQFALGFGPACLSWRKGMGIRLGSTIPEYVKLVTGKELKSDEPIDIGLLEPPDGVSETEYRLNWLPLGGYVKMLGQDDLDHSNTSSDPRSFSSKPVSARMWVISAGVIMNALLAIVLFMTCFMWGVEFDAPVIGAVDPASVATTTFPREAEAFGITEAGIHPGDRIVAINGAAVRNFPDVQTALAMSRPGKPAEIVLMRQDQELIFDCEPVESAATGLLDLGFYPSPSLTVAEFEGTGLLDRLSLYGMGDAAIESNMVLSHVNGIAVSGYWELGDALESVDSEADRVIALRFEDTEESGSGRVVETHVSANPELMTAYFAGEKSETEQQFTRAAHMLGLAPPVYVTSLSPKPTNARDAGVLPGDLIAEVDGVSWPRNDQLVQLIHAKAGDDIRMIVYRDDERHTLTVPVSNGGMIGIGLDVGMDYAILASSILESVIPAEGDTEGEPEKRVHAAASWNPVPGSRVLSVMGEEIASWSDLQVHLLRIALSCEQGESAIVEMQVQLPTVGHPVETIQWEISADEVVELSSLGWRVQLDLFSGLRSIIKVDSPVAAIQIGFKETWRMMVMTYLTIDRLFRGSVKASHLKGVIGIAEVGTKIADKGLSYLIMFLAIISVNLAVLNFLPIPVFDGGWFVFLIIEKIKGSPVSERVQNVSMMIGVFIIGTLLIVTFYNDIMNLFRGTF